MRSKRKGCIGGLLAHVVGALGMLGAATAWADCTGMTRQSVYSFPPSLTVSSTAGNGSLILDTGWLDMGVSQVNCTGPTPISVRFGYSGAMTPNNLGPWIYETGMEGVAIRIVWSKDSSHRPPGIATGTNGIVWPTSSFNVEQGNFSPAQLFRIQMFKLKSGPLTGGTITLPSVEIRYGTHLSNRLLFNALTVNQVRGSCRVVSPLVTLLPIGQEHFRGVGPIDAFSRSFNLELNCDAGLNVSYMVTGDTVAPNVLANNAKGGARGVGVQLVQAGGAGPVLPISQRLGAGKTVESGAIRVPLMARYYQTAAQVSAGEVSAIGEVTLFYD